MIDKVSAERDSNIKKFCQSLDKDIAELGRELKEIKSQANVRVSLVRCVTSSDNLIGGSRIFRAPCGLGNVIE